MIFNTLIFQDPDPSVLTFTLQTLNVILESEGGVVINDNMAKYLVRRIDGGGMPGRRQIHRGPCTCMTSTQGGVN